jgi:hypothetical protein
MILLASKVRSQVERAVSVSCPVSDEIADQLTPVAEFGTVGATQVGDECEEHG